MFKGTILGGETGRLEVLRKLGDESPYSGKLYTNLQILTGLNDG